MLLLFLSTGMWAQEIRLKAPGRHPGAGRRYDRHVILQFPGYPDAAVRENLARRGVRVLEYVPDNALMVSADPAADFSGLDVVWAGSLAADEKISPVLAGQVSGALLAIFHPDVTDGRARQIARQKGFDILSNPGLLVHQLVLSGPLARANELAAFDEV